MNRTVRPSALQLAQVGEQLVDLLRHQHRGRLVEDEDAGAAVEDLEDLDPLPVADAEVLDQPVGLDAQAVGVGDLLDPAAGRHAGRAVRAAVGSAPRMMFSSTVKLSASMKCWCTMPMPAAIASLGERNDDLACRRRGSCPRRDAASRRGSSSGSTCRRRSRRRPRARSPRRTARLMSRLATTPGNRLVIPRSSTASRLGPRRRVSSHGTLHESVSGVGLVRLLCAAHRTAAVVTRAGARGRTGVRPRALASAGPTWSCPAR